MFDFDDDKVMQVPSSVQMTSPEAARTLEQVWQRRRAELADWQPSGGWLVDQRNGRSNTRHGTR